MAPHIRRARATLRRAQLPRTKDAQHRHITGVRVPAGVGVHDIDDPVPLARHLPRAGLIAAGIEAWIVAKPCYGVSDRLKASFGGWPRAGL
jgi:hypothetical protein